MVRLTNTPIIVDEFKYIPGCFIYLLTHLHTDHTGGLTPSWNNGIIFCSEITKRMLLKKFQLQEPERVIALEEGLTYYIPLVPPNPLQDHHQTAHDHDDHASSSSDPSLGFRSGITSTSNNIHSDINVWRDPSYWVKISNASSAATPTRQQLPSSSQSEASTTSNAANNSDQQSKLSSQNSAHSLSQNNVTTSSIQNKTIQAFNSYDRDASYMQVNVVDANHCLGGIMFLLEGYFGTVLFTGDFRYDPRILQTPCFTDKKIDHLYLDDTFLDPVYDFPSRQEAGQEIIQIIKSLPEDTRILIAVDHLGKEELLIALAKTFETLIVVPEERLELLECMNDIIPVQLFTHNPEKGRIIVKSKKEVSFNSIMFYRKSYPKVVGIIPSGWSTKQLKEVKHSDSPLIYRVPYSLHSSYKELIEFVTQVKPKIVYSSSRGDNVSLRDEVKHLCDNVTPMKQVVIPRSVLSHMERSTNLIDHRNSTSVSSNAHSLARQKSIGTNLITPNGKLLTPNTSAAGRKRKSFPPSHRNLPTKLYALPTQTLNPFSNLPSSSSSKGTKNHDGDVVDLTDSTLNNQSIVTSHQGTTVFENTQDLLTNMIFSTNHPPNNKLTDKNTSILSLESSFSKSPSSSKRHFPSATSISSLEALNILDDLHFSPLRKNSTHQPQSPAHHRVVAQSSSPKVSPIPKLKRKKSAEIDKVLVDKTTGIQILLPKNMYHKETKINEMNEEFNDDEYRLSLSPHSGDEQNIMVDESDILQNIELESDEEESIILHTRPIHSSNVKKNHTPPENKRKFDHDDHYVQELSSDDEDVVFTGSFTSVAGRRDSQNHSVSRNKHSQTNDIVTPLSKKMKQSSSTTATTTIMMPENISDTCDLLDIGFSMEMPSNLNTNHEEENLYPKGYSQISWDDDDDEHEKKTKDEPERILTTVEASQPQTSFGAAEVTTSNIVMNLSNKGTEQPTMTTNQLLIPQNNLRAKTKIPFKFDSSGGSQNTGSPHSSLSSLESPCTIQSIFFSKSKK
ncbi:hypothetical protein C9374_008285 [Naegleria lovaniensis]|uniref:5' exonuclease Apollo n=1 Tax=Naegleria lovaniensis TaxID=51637 RepID=A0AA88GK30_NAELO|nr:uncharacterized protein C9374_008285 [Naegleria lovaniensis]KAG2378646.1 hypothetical protein C9374_008285 [Naegleria lovaniensis]